MEIAFDKKQTWMVDHTMVCQACATRDMVMRGKAKEFEDEKPVAGIPLWREGRIVTVRPATEADLQAARDGKRESVTRH